MPYSIAIDVGNTNTKWGLFKDGELLQVVRLRNDSLSQNNLIFYDYQPKEIIVSSVNVEAESNLNLEKYAAKLHKLSYQSKLSFKMDYQSLETIGKDRLAVVAAAHFCFPQTNCLIIDAGTCITYDFLTYEGRYLGGAISPGVQLRLNAMNNYTNKLPLIQWTNNKPESIGNTTISSMLSGVVNGIIGEMNGFIMDFKKQYSDLKIVLTGGDAKFFEKELKNGIFADPNLVLKGLHEILKYNRD